MIPLRIATSPLPIVDPLVVRLRCTADRETIPLTKDDALLVVRDKDSAHFEISGFGFSLSVDEFEPLDHDVLMFIPGQRSAHRLIRANSRHNTFLVTEQCDQLCTMCSQPPKKHHTDLFEQFSQAALLAPADAVIGVSGGEPMLHKLQLFELIETVYSTRPDIGFHVLSNGQHFDKDDFRRVCQSAYRNVLWGIPLYSNDSDVHNRIVGKSDAFEILMSGLNGLARSGAAIEIRTVVLQSNLHSLQGLAAFLSLNLPSINHWAIMQLENIGFGRKNWDKEFVDTSVEFEELGATISIAKARGIEVQLFNFPLCTLPQNYRVFSAKAISDWKQKYLPQCANCKLKESCGGFFEWYTEKNGFRNLGLR